mmetsp:Transcript_6117/g.18480  ORF Transcript_6117/g.18480 Transcript_6117/m.18480 type:complete len:221 (+) Transcript_6117:856-1518(+)
MLPANRDRNAGRIARRSITMYLLVKYLGVQFFPYHRRKYSAANTIDTPASTAIRVSRRNTSIGRDSTAKLVHCTRTSSEIAASTTGVLINPSTCVEKGSLPSLISSLTTAINLDTSSGSLSTTDRLTRRRCLSCRLAAALLPQTLRRTICNLAPPTAPATNANAGFPLSPLTASTFCIASPATTRAFVLLSATDRHLVAPSPAETTAKPASRAQRCATPS